MKKNYDTFRTSRSDLRSGGFSLVEMLVVIAVIGVIAALAIPTIGRVNESAQEASAQRNAQAAASMSVAANAAGAFHVIPEEVDGGGVLASLSVLNEGVTSDLLGTSYQVKLSEQAAEKAAKFLKIESTGSGFVLEFVREPSDASDAGTLTLDGEGFGVDPGLTVSPGPSSPTPVVLDGAGFGVDPGLTVSPGPSSPTPVVLDGAGFGIPPVTVSPSPSSPDPLIFDGEGFVVEPDLIVSPSPPPLIADGQPEPFPGPLVVAPSPPPLIADGQPEPFPGPLVVAPNPTVLDGEGLRVDLGVDSLPATTEQLLRNSFPIEPAHRDPNLARYYEDLMKSLSSSLSSSQVQSILNRSNQ